MIWVIAIVAIVIIVTYVIYDNKKSKKQMEVIDQLFKEEEERLYAPSKKYGKVTSLLKDPLEVSRNYVAFIKEANKIVIHTVDASNWMCDPLIPMDNLDSENVEFDFEDIISYELYSEEISDPDSLVSSSTIKTNMVSLVGKATVGAILAGGIGALIGGLGTTKKMNTFNSQQYTLTFLFLKVIAKSRKHPIYIASYKFHDFLSQKIHWSEWNQYISNVKDILDEILSANNKLSQGQTLGSVSDEIEKLHQLKMKDILTEEEFNKQKEKLLK